MAPRAAAAAKPKVTITQTPQKDLKVRSPRTIGEIIYGLYRIGLYRGSNFRILSGVWVVVCVMVGLGFRVIGFRLQGSGFRVGLGGLGLGVPFLGFLKFRI